MFGRKSLWGEVFDGFEDKSLSSVVGIGTSDVSIDGKGVSSWAPASDIDCVESGVSIFVSLGVDMFSLGVAFTEASMISIMSKIQLLGCFARYTAGEVVNHLFVTRDCPKLKRYIARQLLGERGEGCRKVVWHSTAGDSSIVTARPMFLLIRAVYAHWSKALSVLISILQ